MDQPKGYLVAIGGAEDKGMAKSETVAPNYLAFESGILSSVISYVRNKKKGKIEIITTASENPYEMAAVYSKAFELLGVHNVDHLNIRSRDEVNDEQCLERLRTCDCVLFTGGDQFQLSSIFGGTEASDILKQRYYNERFVIAGSSAGAMAMSQTMIYGGHAALAHLKGEVKMSTGFGLIQNVIIDTHFEKRGRFNRLAQAVAIQPGILGIGLAEDTGIVVCGGERIKVIGSGSVTIIDGKHIKYNNIAKIKLGLPLAVENIIVHFLSKGDVYDLEKRQFHGFLIEERNEENVEV